NAWCIWECSTRTANSKLHWNAYVVEADKEAALAGISLSKASLTTDGDPRGNQTTNQEGRTAVLLQFVGANQKVITQDQFDVFADRSSRISTTNLPERMYLSLLRQTANRDFSGNRLMAGLDGEFHTFFTQFRSQPTTGTRLHTHNASETLNL